MRKRTNQIIVRLSDQEMLLLRRKLKANGMTKMCIRDRADEWDDSDNLPIDVLLHPPYRLSLIHI